jgi:hypothetical protein
MGYILFLTIVIGSLFFVDHLAQKRGWNRSRRAVAAVTLGPLAVPLIYLADAACAIGRTINAPRR